MNLARNAIEASPSGATVALRGRRDGPRIQIDIENESGPIPAGSVGRIFEPFFTTRAAGTGLGLAIARHIVLAQSGDLYLSRNEADLVRFSITIPASTEKKERT